MVDQAKIEDGKHAISWMLGLQHEGLSEADTNTLHAFTAVLMQDLSAQTSGAGLNSVDAEIKQDMSDPARLQQKISQMQALVNTPAAQLTPQQNAALETIGSAAREAHLELVLDPQTHQWVSPQDLTQPGQTARGPAGPDAQGNNTGAPPAAGGPNALGNAKNWLSKQFGDVEGAIEGKIGKTPTLLLEGGVGLAGLMGLTSTMSGPMKTIAMLTLGFGLVDFLVHHSDSMPDMDSSLFGTSRPGQSAAARQFQSAVSGNGAQPGYGPGAAPGGPGGGQDFGPQGYGAQGFGGEPTQGPGFVANVVVGGGGFGHHRFR